MLQKEVDLLEDLCYTTNMVNNKEQQMKVTLKSKVRPAQVGDVIRSLDFPHIFDCYMIGLVVEVKGEVIRCRGISRVWEGRSEEMKEEFTTVQPGYHFMDNQYPNRIWIIA